MNEPKMEDPYKVSRWKVALKAEQAFWDSCLRVKPDCDEGNLDRICEELGLSASFFVGKRVLNLGCGGRARGRCDLEQASLEINVDPLRFSPGLPTCLCIGEALPFQDSSFDLIVSLNVLDHVLSPMNVVREIERTLSRGGAVILTVNVFPQGIGKILNALSPILDKPHLYHFTEREIYQIFETSGMRIVDMKMLETPRETFKGHMSRLVAMRTLAGLARKGR